MNIDMNGSRMIIIIINNNDMAILFAVGQPLLQVQ